MAQNWSIAAPLGGSHEFCSANLRFHPIAHGVYTRRPSRYLHDRAGWDGGQVTFGPNAFNSALDRTFNAYNLTLHTGEQTANSILGGTQVPALNAGLFLTGGGTGVFNTNGGIGGLEGIFDQTPAAYVDLAG